MLEAMVEREGEGCVLRLVDWEDGIAVGGFNGNIGYVRRLVEWEDGIAVGGFNGNILRLAWLRWVLLSERFLCQWS